MTTVFSVESIKELMQSFYRLSGIRFVLFDENFREILSFPEENCRFCKAIRSCPQTRRKCTVADRRAFRQCAKENQLVVYPCHAGLIEAVMPLHDNEKTVGYLMFGQVTDIADKQKLYESATLIATRNGLDAAELRAGMDEIIYKSPEEIAAAAKIMEACTSYIIYKELITPDNSRVVALAKQYIEEHLGVPLDMAQMCKEVGIGRTKLYELFSAETRQGIAAYLRRRRMHRAKKLLKSTDLSIAAISEQVGFIDYNYFSRVFKKTYGRSPKEYRK